MAGAATTGRRTCSAASHQAAATSTPRPRSRVARLRGGVPRQEAPAAARGRGALARAEKWTRPTCSSTSAIERLTSAPGRILYARAAAREPCDCFGTSLRQMRNGPTPSPSTRGSSARCPSSRGTSRRRSWRGPSRRRRPATSQPGPSRSGLPPHATARRARPRRRPQARFLRAGLCDQSVRRVHPTILHAKSLSAIDAAVLARRAVMNGHAIEHASRRWRDRSTRRFSRNG